MTTDRRRPGIAAGLFTLVGLAILIGLGVWQVQRLKWKTALLHRIEALHAAPPEPIDTVLRRIPDHIDVNFTRVQLTCQAVHATPALRLYGIQKSAPGYRLVTACPIPSGPFGSVLVDRGFLPQTGSAPPVPVYGPAIAVPVVGVLRTPDRRNIASAPNQPAQNLWYWRDIPAMAAALRAVRPAPVFLVLESPAAASGTPAPSLLPADIPNNHLGYAITWFGLAAALAGVYLAMLFRGRPD